MTGFIDGSSLEILDLKFKELFRKTSWETLKDEKEPEYEG
jgi:hypothetical protein